MVKVPILFKLTIFEAIRSLGLKRMGNSYRLSLPKGMCVFKNLVTHEYNGIANFIIQEYIV